MSEEEKSRWPQSPIAIWEQWYETASRVWAQNMEGGKEAFVDPYGLYRAWMKSATEAQQQLMTSTTKALEPQEAWKRWFEATTEPWRKLIADGADPSGLVTRWLEMMEEARTRLLQGGSIPADPFTFFKQWYDATSETWSKMIGETIGSDRYMQEVSQFLESYTSFAGAARRAGEEYFGHLQLSTRADAARIAELVINVENKVEKLDEAFEDFEDSNAQAVATTDDTLAGVVSRLDGLEQSFAKLPGTLQKAEEKLDKLDTAFASFEKSSTKTLAGPGDRVEQLEQRLDRVESKLDKLLSALEHIEAR